MAHVGKKIVTFFQDAWLELCKVTWPTKVELKDATIVVIVSMVLVGAFIGGIDYLITIALKYILQ